jgi:hypothetical protein
VRRLLERNLQVVAQVGAAKDRGTAAASAAEDLAEDVAEDVAESAHAAAARRRLRIDAGVPELVVGGALVRVRQDLVGFLRLLEMLLGLRIVRIAVRMPLHSEAPIGLLQIVLGAVLVHPEHFVVVALCHCSLFRQTNGPRRRAQPVLNASKLNPFSCPSLR